MKIGLIRHLKVKKSYPKSILTQELLFQWLQEYDSSDVEDKEINLGQIKWDRCYSSDMIRGG
ncbi:hypothetical protein [Bacillus sp. SA1-12]|uniref:hypothetical protein n=1 Tax=Bacillus sp. SA1-12 TaxID=1455638 RepID=UPI0006968590|nr:hypothetical protein [Bacillus sp. SA1-12]